LFKAAIVFVAGMGFERAMDTRLSKGDIKKALA
jgi:hypothetical protein